MLTETEQKRAVVDAIRRQLRIFNLITLFILYVLLFLVVRFLSVLVDYVTPPSLVAIVSIVAGLVVIGMYLANASSGNAIRRIEEYTRHLSILLNTTREIRESEYIDVLLENIMESSLRITGADAGSLLLIEGEQMVFKVVRGPHSARLTGLSVPKSRGVVWWAVDNRSSVRIDNAADDPRFDPGVDAETGYGTKSVLCIPLVVNSKPIGALEILNKKSGFFTYNDEALVSYFADQAATAILRAQFYEDQKNYEINLTDILINTLDNYMNEKSGHSRRVARYSLLMAKALHMTDEEKKRLYRACLLHDIGFLRIKLNAVSSKDQYTAHPTLGYEMLRPVNFYADIAPVVLHHHERYDGKGYPSGLKGEAIPLDSRVIAIAEAFDAMVSRDSYRYSDQDLPSDIPAFQYAKEELQANAGAQFDAELVQIFVDNIDETSLESAYEFPG